MSNQQEIRKFISDNEEKVMDLVERSMTDSSYEGICLDCGEITDGVEPDAECYRCPSCGAHKVIGGEMLAISAL